MLERLFQLKTHHTTVSREVFAGITTFFAMSYIIFLQPAILSGALMGNPTGIDFDAQLTVTVLASAFATLIMGLLANYPIALAPGMGQNFYFIFSVIPAAAALGSSSPWQTALGSVFVAGVLFLIISLSGIRKSLIGAVSPSMRKSIAAGIGIFIAFIGLRNAGLITADPGTLVSLSHPTIHSGSIVFLAGSLITIMLISRNVPAAIFLGMVFSTLIAVLAGFLGGTPVSLPDHLFSLPGSPLPLVGQLDILGNLQAGMIPVILILLFMDLFDTSGTLIAAGQEVGIIQEDGEMPGIHKAFTADAAGTVAGAWLGTSTVTSYIESGAGIEAGGRTGLTAITVAILFLLSLFFLPVVRTVGGIPAVTSPALFIVGIFMVRNLTGIEWSDPGEAFPAFLTMISIPLTFSIGHGIALGLLVYPLSRALTGKMERPNLIQIGLSILIAAFFLFADHSFG